MIKLLLLFVLPISLFSSKILSYNIYDRTDRVDVMITFDTPYAGVIKQSIGSSMITIKLEDASIESSKLKRVSSKFLQSLSITPMSKYTKIVAFVPNTVVLQASKTADAYGLRLRFKTKTVSKVQKNKNIAAKNSLSSLPTKKDDGISSSYYIVVGILIIGIIILFYIKKRVTPTSKIKSKKSNTWLFQNTQETSKTVTNSSNTNSTNDVSIRFQKSIDNENSVVMLDFSEQSYLVLMGKSNILLDKFQDNKPVTQSEFETILQDRHKELDDFLNNEATPPQQEVKKEPLQAYKERAAAMVYES